MNMDKLKMLIMNKLNINPMFRDLIQKAQKGDKQGVENFARNICKERGIDFDKEFANFMSNFK